MDLLKRQNKVINCPAFDSQESGRNNICRLRTGDVRYHKIAVDFKVNGVARTEAQLKDEVEEIVIKLNEKDLWRISLTNYLLVETTVNRLFEIKNGLVVLHFANEGIEGEIQQKLTSIGTYGVANMTLEVKLKSGLTSPTLKAYAQVDNVIETPNLVRHLRQKTWAVTETGVYDKSIQGRRAEYRGVHLLETVANDITNLQIKYENEYLIDCNPKVLESMNLDHGYKVASGQIYVPFDRGIIPDALPSKLKAGDGIVRDAGFDFALTMKNANSVQLVEDFYASPDI